MKASASVADGRTETTRIDFGDDERARAAAAAATLHMGRRCDEIASASRRPAAAQLLGLAPASVLRLPDELRSTMEPASEGLAYHVQDVDEP